ncbi:MAG: hypothetical protein H6R08_2103 [Proteobacteria bacterium]|jgi:hypothetical protein|nr:hypothetical protein [Pseudomonadota bacterium]
MVRTTPLLPGNRTVLACISVATLLAAPALAVEYTDGPAVAVPGFKSEGPGDPMGKGLAAMIVVDLVNLTQNEDSKYLDCKMAVVEWDRRDEVLKEIELSQRPEFDPATRLENRLIDPRYFVEGTVTTGADNQTTSWSLQVRDARTGQIVALDKGQTDKPLDVSGEIADRLACSLCRKGRGYSGKPLPFQNCTPALPPDAPVKDAAEPSPADAVDKARKAIDKVKSLKGLWGG